MTMQETLLEADPDRYVELDDMAKLGTGFAAVVARIKAYEASHAPVDEPKRLRCQACRDDESGMKPSGGWDLLDRPRGRMTPCDCRNSRRVRKVIRAIAKGVPPNWQMFSSFDRLRPYVSDTALAELEGYVELYLGVLLGEIDPEREGVRASDGLWLVGPSGSAKTAAASTVMQEISRRLRERDHVRWKHEWSKGWWSFDELLDQLRDAMDVDSDTNTLEILKGIAGVDLLLLDDLAATHIKSWGASRLNSVLNRRIDNCKPTIVTTDVTADDLSQLLSAGGSPSGGERIVRRLQDFTVQVEFLERVFTREPQRSYARYRPQRPAPASLRVDRDAEEDREIAEAAAEARRQLDRGL